MKYLVKKAIALVSYIGGQVLYYTRSFDETDWIIVLFCAFAFGCFTVNDCTKRKRI